MFDNLRRQSAQDQSAAYEEETLIAAEPARTVRTPAFLLGLTPPQRFVLSLMLFLNVTVLGCLALLVFERIALF